MRKRLIIFDLDGTLYKLKGGSYSKSPLKKAVLKNARDFISLRLGKNKIEAKTILNSIQKKYEEQISIGLEKELGISRYDYFNIVWNIPARNIVRKSKNIREILLVLKKEYELVIVSDAPLVWIKNVLKELSVNDLFLGKIFSGEGNRRKGFNNVFSYISKTLKVKSSNCIVIGDQNDTDIIPAKELGMKTIFVHNKQLSKVADLNIRSIQNVVPAIKKLV